MINGAYLSDAIEYSQLKYGKINLIKTNCGSGKSYFAIHKLAGNATTLSNVVYLTDTAAMRDSLSKDPRCKVYSPSDRSILNGECIKFEDNKIIVMTYQKMGILLKYNPDLFDAVEILICDEIHKVPEYIEWDRKRAKKSNLAARDEEVNYWVSCGSCYHAAKVIQQMASGIKINAINDVEVYKVPKLVVALSATPKQAYAQFTKAINDVSIDAQLVAYETYNTIYYTDLATTIRNLDEDGQVLLYVPYIRDIKSGVKLARDMGYRAEGIWSLRNGEFKMNEEQKALREYILEKQELPPQYDLVFINQAYETAINIRGNIKCMVIHTIDPDKRIQARNRFRGDLETQYLLADSQSNEIVKVPVQFLETYLDKEKKKELCKYMNMKTAAGEPAGWTTVKKKLIEAGYKIENKMPRVNGKQVSCAIIHCND